MKLHTKILLGLVLGAVAGVSVNILAGEATWVEWLNTYVTGPLGQIFLRLLFMVVIPLVFATLSLGVAGLGDLGKLGRVGAKTLAYFLTTTALAVALGLFLVNTVRPGEGLPPEVTARLVEQYGGETAQRVEESGARDFGIETFVSIVPRNPIRAAADLDMLGVIFFSIMFGAALTLIPRERAKPLINVLEALADAVTKLIELAMRLAPYGVFGLIFVTTSRFGFGLLQQLAVYVAVVLAGLLVHSFVTLSLILRGAAGINPWRFWSAIREVVITAFSTSSSNATLPTSLLVAERTLRIPPQIGGFVLPLGATMNMNGTSLFEGVTVLFVAQVFGIDLSLGQQLVVVVLSVLTAVGAAGVPGGSIPLLIVMATTVGVPGEGIGLILGVDRILDMCRTTVNVSGDLTAACVIARSEGVWRAEKMDEEIDTFEKPIDEEPEAYYQPPAL
jgi:DAACS family dicarboxylate/amino acid:cation (Na+ or H+) symporter